MPNGNSKKWSALSWAEWKGEMGAKVETIENSVSKIFDLVGALDRSMSFMKGKAAAYGALGGGITGFVLLLVKLLMDRGG